MQGWAALDAYLDNTLGVYIENVLNVCFANNHISSTLLLLLQQKKNRKERISWMSSGTADD